MVWALLPLLFLVFIFGFTAIERDMSSVTPPAAPVRNDPDTGAASAFMAYRNAVMVYAKQLLAVQGQNFAGTVPPTAAQLDLSSAQINSLPADAQAVIVPASTGYTSNLTTSYGSGYVVCVWMSVPTGTVGQLVNQLNGNLTIGTVTGSNTWVQTGPGGGVSLQIPSGCLSYATGNGGTPSVPKAGDIISVAGLAGQ